MVRFSASWKALSSLGFLKTSQLSSAIPLVSIRRFFAESHSKDQAKTERNKEKERELEYTRLRKETVAELKKQVETDPYPHKYFTTHTIEDIIRQFKPACSDSTSTENHVKVSFGGRIESIRKSGKNLMFANVQADGQRLQVILETSAFADSNQLQHLRTHLHRGDIIGVTGSPCLSKSGEFSVKANSAQLLAPCLQMLPDVYFGLLDSDLRHRNRHIDLLTNDQTRRIFEKRSLIISALRSEFVTRGFLEVETPSLNQIPGGAAAKPFWTHHNDLKQQMSLRISPELYLKSLVVGGMNRVFEIGKNFRNEQIDATHNPEFTACEAYCAYADYEDMMRFTEEVLGGILQKVSENGQKMLFETEDSHGKSVTLDFTPPFHRLDIKSELEKSLGCPLPEDLSTEAAQQFFDSQCVKLNVDCPTPRTTARLIDKLVGKLLETRCEQPTFLMNYPQITSPLAKPHRSIPGWTERFELFILGNEYVNAYTELNDPSEQRRQFELQALERAKGNDEACEIDEAFVRTLEYGLPPTAGWGIGIDRLVMLLTRSHNLQDVILFPAMRSL